MRKKRSPKMASAPMLVMRGLRNDEVELRERMAVEAFARGFASEDHFDTLSDMQGVLVLAGSTSDQRRPAMLYAKNTLAPVLASIRARYERTEKMGCTGDELIVLQGFVSKYRDFWLRQPVGLYEAACEELQKFLKKLAQEQKEAA